ncbi:hypothetical protein BV898_08704 [Hypsibius exemplaris]|uniref:Uncharacterized protein n=1 Tax=Hypsibius exemplaris TaxID=2072580 RepID=A0A1W0WPS5_HYPEX|nr:hypothetical protein BV898_08704 [Hypsibius exemplaris]
MNGKRNGGCCEGRVRVSVFVVIVCMSRRCKDMIDEDYKPYFVRSSKKELAQAKEELAAAKKELQQQQLWLLSQKQVLKKLRKQLEQQSAASISSSSSSRIAGHRFNLEVMSGEKHPSFIVVGNSECGRYSRPISPPKFRTGYSTA